MCASITSSTPAATWLASSTASRIYSHTQQPCHPSPAAQDLRIRPSIGNQKILRLRLRMTVFSRQNEVQVAELMPEIPFPEGGGIGHLQMRPPRQGLQHRQVGGPRLMHAGEQGGDGA